MIESTFRLKAQVSSSSPQLILETVKKFIGSSGKAAVHGGIIEISAELEGESARDLNRILLSEMRRVEKKTTLRAEWTSNGLTERFFDYVSKGIRKSS
jgi:hypothetical protein